MKKFIPVLALVFAFGVSVPAFANDPAPAPTDKKEMKDAKKDAKKDGKKEEKK
jgi:hypothetical protein